MQNSLTVALVQCSPRSADVAANLAGIESAARSAQRAGCAVLVAPEMAATGYNIGAGNIARLAEPRDGAIADCIARMAIEYRLAVVYGYPERDGLRLYNSAQLIDRDGRRLLNYRKSHLFGAGERATFASGDTLDATCTLDGWRVGLMICYDIEFPEAARLLALAGADAVFVPTALMQPYAQIPDVLIAARAYENQVYIVYANYCGQEGDLDYCGNSLIAAPSGAVLARGALEPAILTAELCPEELKCSRRLNTYLSDRRPALYRNLAAAPTTP